MHILTRTRTWLTQAVAVALLATAALLPQVSHAQAFSDYLENKIVDWLFRGQAYSPPTPLYVGLATGACADSGLTGEVSGNNYSRASVASSLANWAGTQSAGSTTASSGTGGVTSNNNAITFATPSGTWGTVATWGLFDAAAAGNLLLCASLTASKVINSGDTVSFSAGSLTVTVQ